MLCLFILMAMMAASSALEAKTDGKRHALLIAINDYAHWTPLNNPIPDMRTLAAELRHRYGFLPEVVENPTREDIVAKLRRYIRQDYGPDDQLVIAFAGHGTYDAVSDIGYLVAKDSYTSSDDPNFLSTIPYPWLLALIDNIDSPNILLIVDACYSGSLSDFGGRMRGGGDGGGAVRRFLTAGGKEYVPDGDVNQHTPFMRRLLKGLRALKTASDTVRLGPLYGKFMRNVEPSPRIGSFGQHAGMEDFVFTLRNAAPAPRPQLAIASTTAAAPAAAVASVAVAVPVARAAAPRLRPKPERLSDRDIRFAFEKLEIFDAGRNSEGDFPNQFRAQKKNGRAVVVDLESSLMWQQAGSEYRLTIDEAVAYIKRLNEEAYGGYRDWRLPTVEELGSLIEPQRKADSLYISPRFDTEQEACWTADRDRRTTDVYFVSFNTGKVRQGYGGPKAFVRAVRSL
ncbi:MAG: DUF1566 domain-containing protein [Acidobacteriota bacterium]